jgi:hypothetical protein
LLKLSGNHLPYYSAYSPNCVLLLTLSWGLVDALYVLSFLCEYIIYVKKLSGNVNYGKNEISLLFYFEMNTNMFARL